MLNVTIQNDGKIKIQTECSNTKEMRSNVNLLLAIVSSMEMEEQVNKENAGASDNLSYYLYLKKVGINNKINTTKAISNMVNIGLQKARNIVNAVASGEKMLIMQSFDVHEIESVKEYLESQECVCEITKN